MTEFYQEDLAILEKTVEEPVRQMIVVEVNSPTQTRQIARQISEWSQTRYQLNVSFDANNDDANRLFEKCKAALENGKKSEDNLALLIVGDESPTNARIQHREAKQPTSVGFWRTMNQLREQWNDLPSQTIFLVTSQQYFFLTTEADHLKRWIPLKLHCLVEEATSQEKGSTNRSAYLTEILTSGEFSADDLQNKDFAETCRISLNEHLRLALQRGDAAESLAHRYYLPLMAAAITLGNWGDAKNYDQRLCHIDLPSKQYLRWLRLRSYLEFRTGEREAGIETARQYYQLAQSIDDKDAQLSALWSLSQFYEQIGDIDETEITFQQILKLAPKNAGTLNNYANFLHKERRDFDRAENFYLRAIEAKPNYAAALSNYATSLRQENRDSDQIEALYLRAIEADPEHAVALGNYANFLYKERRDFDRAEEFYLRALEADSKDVNILNSYTLFLERARHNLARAEEVYLRAIAANPKHAGVLGSYAEFLSQDQNNFDRAEEFYLRAIKSEPRNAHVLGDYATFLKDKRYSFNQAEEFYLRAIDAAPRQANNLGNYALFLKDKRHDIDRAEEFYLRAIDAAPRHADILENYAIFLENERRDFDRAEEFFLRAIKAAPKDASNIGNYAIFLCQVRTDYVQGETYFARAIKADERNSTWLISYAATLLIQIGLTQGGLI